MRNIPYLCNRENLWLSTTTSNEERGSGYERKKLGSLIDIAIEREEEAYGFYMGLCNRIEDESVKDTLKFLANEEQKHKEFLVNYRSGRFGTDSLRLTDVVDYKIAEYLEEPDIKKGHG